MELDTTQQQRKGSLSAQEKEQQQNKKLCFACGKSGHMSRDCQIKQQNRSLQQNREQTQINATQDRGAYNTTRIMKPTELRADNDYQGTQETNSEHGNPKMVPNIKPLRAMMQNNTALTEEEIEEIMSLSYENLRQPARAETGSCESKESDETEVITHQEPVQELSPDSLVNEDWQDIDFLNKEYNIQWNSHEPNMERLLEISDTPQNNNTIPIQNKNESDSSMTESGSQDTKVIDPEALKAIMFAADIARSIQEKPMRFSHKVRHLYQDMSDYCLHQNLECWEKEAIIWDDHLKRCSNHPIFCGICH